VTGLFITGTDTGVGKTFVAKGLLDAGRRVGLRVAALKPAETGCDGPPADGTLLGAEVPFTFRTPVAPAVAARLEPDRPGFDLELVRLRYLALAAESDLVLVEGAGGLLVPYSDTVLGADLIAAFGLPVLIVARASLGTINHTLLTIAACRQRGITVCGVVLNETSPRGPDFPHNAREIEHHGGIPVLATLETAPPPARFDVLLARLAS
jgi:dethiobiotin synthetase